MAINWLSRAETRINAKSAISFISDVTLHISCLLPLGSVGLGG